MNKLLKCLVLAAVLCPLSGAFAKEATITEERIHYAPGCMNKWTPVALTLVGPVGLPCGDWDINGFQLGLWNSVYQFSGLQLGIVNIADRAYGVQIGVVNVITSNDIPFFPILNWSF